MPEDVAPPRSAEILADKIRVKLSEDSNFAEQLKQNPSSVQDLAAISIAQSDGSSALQIRSQEAERAKEIVTADKEVYIFAVRSLGIVAVLAVLAIMLVCVPQLVMLLQAAIKAANGSPNALGNISISFSVPDGLVALGSAAIGALAGLLGPLSARQ